MATVICIMYVLGSGHFPVVSLCQHQRGWTGMKIQQINNRCVAMERERWCEGFCGGFRAKLLARHKLSTHITLKRIHRADTSTLACLHTHTYTVFLPRHCAFVKARETNFEGSKSSVARQKHFFLWLLHLILLTVGQKHSRKRKVVAKK